MDDMALWELCESFAPGRLTLPPEASDASENLWPEQTRSVRLLNKAIADGHRRIILCKPTGAGKTVTIAHVIRRYAAAGKTCLFLVHRRQLVWQASKRLTLNGIPHGLIAGGVKPQEAMVQVASVQAQGRRPLGEYDVIFVDEAHRGEHDKVLDMIGPKPLVIGLSATPQRGSGQGLAWWHHLVVGSVNSELIANGRIVKPVMFQPNVADLSRAEQRAGEISERSAAELMDGRVVGGIVDAWAAKVPGSSTVAFCATIDHARAVADQFKAAGHKAEALDSRQERDEQHAVLDRFCSGETTVLTNVAMLCEGYDLPSMETVIILRPTLSKSLYIQMAGRGARAHPGKTHYTLIDGAGAIALHGFPHADHDFRLDSEARKNRTSSQTVIRTCRNCFYVFEAHIAKCPECGNEAKAREVKYVRAELVEVTDEPTNPRAPEKSDNDLRRHFYYLAGVKKIAGDYKHVWVKKHVVAYKARRENVGTSLNDYIREYVHKAAPKPEKPAQPSPRPAAAADSKGQLVMPGLQGPDGKGAVRWEKR